MNNPRCDGDKCESSSGPVKRYDLGGGSAAILCFECWVHENQYRFDRMYADLRAAKLDLGSLKTTKGKEIADRWPQRNWFATEDIGD